MTTLYEYLLYFVALPSVTFLLSFRAWLKYGRDGKGKGLVIPQYDSPDDLSPAEVGVLDDYKSTDREITATIIDLTIRGYIRIHQIQTNKRFVNRSSYAFELLKDDVLELKEHEQELLDGLFGVYTAKKTAHIQKSITDPKAKAKVMRQYPADMVSLVGRRVTLDEVRPYFYSRVVATHEKLYDNITRNGYFTRNPLYGSLFMSFVGLSLIVSAIIVRGTRGIGLCLSSLPPIFFALLMQARSNKGQLAKEYIDGFRLYLQAAEQDRIASLQAPHTSEIRGLSQVHLYEHFLPYAIALGLEGEWSKKFAHVYKSPPAWIDTSNIAYSINEVIALSDEVKYSLVTNIQSKVTN